jgi:hypothetical protein
MFLGEMLMGSDLDGEEPGDDSKCILVVNVNADSVRGGSLLYIRTCGHFRRYKIAACFRGFFRQSSVAATGPRCRGGLMMYDAGVGSGWKNRVAGATPIASGSVSESDLGDSRSWEQRVWYGASVIYKPRGHWLLARVRSSSQSEVKAACLDVSRGMIR